MTSRSKLALLTALATEHAALARCIGDSSQVVLLQCGVGAAKAREGFRAALARGAGRVVFMGFAGGLRAEALPGRLLVPQQVLYRQQRLAVEADWGQRICRSMAQMNPATEPLLCVDSPLLDVEVKARHAKEAIGCDMESAAILALASQHKVPAAVIRVVLDGPDDPVPPLALRMADADGNFRWPSLGEWMHPGQCWQVARLVPRFRLARRRLQAAATRLVGECERRSL